MSAPSIPIVTQYPVASNQTLQFYWTPPVIGAPLSGYTLILNPGALTYSVYPGATDYIVTGLTNGTTYTAELYATNGNGNGPAVTFESAEPGFLANPPDSAAATAINPGTVVVSWSPPSILPVAPIRYYVIEVVSSDPADNASPIRYTATSNQNSLLVPNLNASKLYSFRVYTVNSVGYSGGQTTNSVSFRDNQGQVQWATGLFSSTQGSAQAQQTAIDKDGNIYVSLSILAGPTFNFFEFVSAPSSPGSLISTTVAATYTGTMQTFSTSHIVLVKYNSSGVLQWAVPIEQQFSGGSISNPIALSTDIDGNVICAVPSGNFGRFRFNNFVSINPSTKQVQVAPFANYNVFNNLDIVLFKYSGSGQFQWMTTMGSPGSQEAFGGLNIDVKTIITDNQNNICVWFINSPSGDISLTYFYNAATLVGTSLTPVFYGGCLGKGFLVKYNPQGQILWINRYSESGTASQSFTNAITTDNNNNIITTLVSDRSRSTIVNTVVGISAGILSTTQTTIIPAITPGASRLEPSILKHNPNGVVISATRLYDISTFAGPVLNLRGLATDTQNAIYIAGSNNNAVSKPYLNSYYSTLDGSNISTTRGPILQNVTSADLYILKYSSSLQFQTAVGFYTSVSSIGMQATGGIACDSYNNVYFSGNFRSNIQIRSYLSTSYNDAMVWSTIATTSNYNFSTTSFLAKFDSNLNFKWLTILASHDGDVGVATTTINYSISIDRSNNLYTSGVWPVRNPMFMQFSHASTLTTGNYIQTQSYGYISSFTSSVQTGTSSFNNSYLAKFA